MALELADILEREDIHEVYICRYRAEYVMKRLWRIAQGLSSWSHLPDASEMWHERAEGSAGKSMTGSAHLADVSGAALAQVKIPASAALRVDEHHLYLYATEVKRAMRALNRTEFEALEEWLNLRRHSAVFWVSKKHAMVRRSPSATRVLEEAAMRIAGTAEVVA